jgi:putative transposase
MWGSHITYIRLRHGWLYLGIILDRYAHYILSWTLDATLTLPFVLDAADRALWLAIPVIWNMNQGSPFTRMHTTKQLQVIGTRISMADKGRCPR